MLKVTTPMTIPSTGLIVGDNSDHCFLFQQKSIFASEESGKIQQLSGQQMKTLCDEVDQQPVTAIFQSNDYSLVSTKICLYKTTDFKFYQKIRDCVDDYVTALSENCTGSFHGTVTYKNEVLAQMNGTVTSIHEKDDLIIINGCTGTQMFYQGQKRFSYKMQQEKHYTLCQVPEAQFYMNYIVSCEDGQLIFKNFDFVEVLKIDVPGAVGISTHQQYLTVASPNTIYVVNCTQKPILEQKIPVNNLLRHVCTEFDNKLVIYMITLWGEFKKLEYVQTNIQMNEQQNDKEEESLSEELIEEEEEPEPEIEDNLLQKAIKLRQQTIQDPFRNFQQFVQVDEIVHQEFINFDQKTQMLQNATKTILRLCQHGTATLQKTNDFVCQFAFNDFSQRKQCRSKSVIVDADIAADAYCYVNQFQLEVIDIKNDLQKWRATFSRLLKPMKIALGSINFCCVLYDNYLVQVFAGGVVIFSEQIKDLQDVAMQGQYLCIVRRTNLQIFDCQALKVIYTAAVSAQRLNAMFCDHLVVLSNPTDIYALNYLSQADDNACLVHVHSFLETQYLRVTKAHKLILDVHKGHSDQLQRKIVDDLKVFYQQLVFCQIQGGKLQFFYVEHPQEAFQQSFQYLVRAMYKNDDQKLSLNQMFEDDLQKMIAEYPIIDNALNMIQLNQSNLNVADCSPPINNCQNQLESLERELIIQEIILNTHLTFDDTPHKAEIQFDSFLLQLIPLIIEQQNHQKLKLIVSKMRCKTSVDKARESLPELSEFCQGLLTTFFTDVDYLSEFYYLRLNQVLMSTDQSLYGKRMDEFAFAFGAENARQQFQQLHSWVKQEVETFIQEQKKLWQKKAATSPEKIIEKPKVLVKVQEEEDLNIINDPKGNKKFLQLLAGKQKPEAKEELVVQIANPTTSPLKSSKVGLSQLLGKK